MRAHRRLPTRAIDAAAYLRAFVLSGVVTVLAVRAYLQAANYPQLGGGGLHIAHVLRGGLLLVVGLGIALVFLGGGPRTAGAVVGGFGFGLFIDEVGKFVTARTDCFYALDLVLSGLPGGLTDRGARPDAARRGHRRAPAAAPRRRPLSPSAVLTWPGIATVVISSREGESWSMLRAPRPARVPVW
ncbi:hypothetical protein [Micromonospora sp. AKA38]|uniref:hypothetical protein n=1 Tax=Micromonospora sp. AKA38 TaxID=2733861 RepID=UPI0022CA432F|nr:hypothetical protein TPA0908_01180 [Micromonospora sp. AKA38]